MDAILINLNDYERSGEGFNGASYFHKTDPDVMIKLYNPSADIHSVISEQELSRKVYELGISVPKPRDFITDGQGRYGIRFQRLRDKVSFSRAVANEPERVEELARRFAAMCLKLHSTDVSGKGFESIKERDLRELEASPFFSDGERKRTRQFILDAPDATTAIHGDLQYSNGIITPDGEYFIDLGDFACGHPYFDLGQVMLSCCYSPDDFIRETFHMEPSLAREFWRFFVMGYFGDDANQEEIKELISPYSGLMCLLIDRCSGYRNENFHNLLPK